MTLRARLVIASAIVIALSIALLGAFVVRTARATLTDQIDSQIVIASDKKVNNPPRNYGDGPKEPNNQNQYASLTFDAGGNLIDAAPSGYSDDPDPLPDLSSMPPGGSERAERFDQITTISSVDGEMRYRIYVCYGRDGEIIATAAPLTGVDSAIDRILRFTLGAVVVALLLAGISSWLLIRNSLKPVDRMIDTAAAIAAGDLSRRAPDANPRTELGRLSQALNEMLGQIEESVDAKVESERRLRRFVADAAHELRTPLTSLRGFAELHRAGALNDAQQLNNAMRRIESESGRMQRLVDDLLMLARLDEQRGVERAPVDLSPLIEESIEAARAIEPDRPITASLAPDAVVLGDAGHLRQIFDNLLTNARIHTPAGTPVSVSTRAEDREVVITVADRGPGISREDQDRIFERFWRADPSRTRATGGSGLGLAIVASLVRAHDGSISLDSEPGAGASFTLRFPRQKSDSAAGTQPAPERISESNRPRGRTSDASPRPSHSSPAD